MESRKIVIVSSMTQKKNVIESSAETLKELKEDLVKNNINYNNCVFYEGLSKTEIKSDDSILPHDIPYKGKVTNELVFMLTSDKKNIKSGFDGQRKDLYAKIKELHLENVVKDKYGKNFTMCKTCDLVEIVDNYTKEDTPNDTPEVKTIEVETKPVNKEVKDELNDCDYITKGQLREIFSKLFNDLDSIFDIYLYVDDYPYIGNAVSHKDVNDDKSPYSSDELDDILSDVM